MPRRFRAGCIAAGVLIAPAGVEAAGFALREQSATAQGAAFAGVTGAARDVSYLFFNPAALAFQSGTQLAFVATGIAVSTKVKDATGTTVIGPPIGGQSRAGDVGNDAVVPALYAGFDLPRNFRLGVGVNAPFGLGTDYPDDWVGRYHALESQLTTVNINPVLAWRPLPWLGLGVGGQIQYVHAKLTSAVDFGSIGAAAGIPGAVPAGQDGEVKVEGDDWALGFTAGVIAEPRAGTRIGVGYRSELDHKLEGNGDFDLDNAGIGAAIRAATGAFADSNVSANLRTPASLSLGVAQDLGPDWTLLADASWTGWSSFDDLTIKFDNENQPDSVTEENWEDSWFFAAGAEWRATDAVTLRTGLAWDQSPVPGDTRTPRVPDDDRFWLSIGGSWQPLAWCSVDLALTQIFVDSTNVNLRADEPGNTFRGNLDADYETDITLLALSARLNF